LQIQTTQRPHKHFLCLQHRGSRLMGHSSAHTDVLSLHLPHPVRAPVNVPAFHFIPPSLPYPLLHQDPSVHDTLTFQSRRCKQNYPPKRRRGVPSTNCIIVPGDSSPSQSHSAVAVSVAQARTVGLGTPEWLLKSDLTTICKQTAVVSARVRLAVCLKALTTRRDVCRIYRLLCAL
jgi:hypothetical protein